VLPHIPILLIKRNSMVVKKDSYHSKVSLNTPYVYTLRFTKKVEVILCVFKFADRSVTIPERTVLLTYIQERRLGTSSAKDMIVLVCPEIYQMEAGANDQVKRYSDICHSTSNLEKANQQYASVQECRRTSARQGDTDTCCHPCTYAELSVGRERT
jgi:hypothetical protein